MPTKKKTSKPASVKRGRLSAAEKQYIASHVMNQNAEQIAKKLGRQVDQIQKEMDIVTGMKPEASLSLESQLESRPEWRQSQKQFDEDELEEFKHQYVQIMSHLQAQ